MEGLGKVDPMIKGWRFSRTECENYSYFTKFGECCLLNYSCSPSLCSFSSGFKPFSSFLFATDVFKSLWISIQSAHFFLCDYGSQKSVSSSHIYADRQLWTKFSDVAKLRYYYLRIFKSIGICFVEAKHCARIHSLGVKTHQFQVTGNISQNDPPGSVCRWLRNVPICFVKRYHFSKHW